MSIPRKAIKRQEFYKELQKEIKERNEYTILDMILLLEVEMHKQNKKEVGCFTESAKNQYGETSQTYTFNKITPFTKKKKEYINDWLREAEPLSTDFSNLPATVFQCYKCYMFSVFHHICSFPISAGVKNSAASSLFPCPFPSYLCLVLQPPFCMVEQNAIIHD
jgi:hypothetical protein